MSIASPVNETSRQASVAPPGKHHQRIDRLRDQERQRRLTITGFGTLLLIAVLLGLVGVIDFYAEASLAARLVLLGCTAAAAVFAVLRLRKWSAFESADAVCRAEQAWPEMGQRLRTSHDYQTRPDEVSPANPELLGVLETQTQERVLERPVKPLGKSWPIGALFGILLLFIFCWLAALVFSPQWRVTTGRLLLLPIHYSTIQMDPLPEYVDQGEDLVVRLQVEGRPIESAQLRYRNKNGDAGWNEVSMRPESGDDSQTEMGLVGALSAVVPDCQEDFEIQVLADPFGDDRFDVAVRLPLLVESWTAVVEPPAYTGLPSSVGKVDDARIPEGSSIELAAHYNRPPSEVRRGGVSESDSAAKVQLADSVARLAMKAGAESIDVQLEATTADRVSDQSSIVLNVIPDRAPTLRFLSPQENAEAIPTAELRFTVEAFDDYAVDSLEIRYRIDDGEEQVLWRSTEESGAVPELSKTVTLALEELNLSYPQAITYYAVATDNRMPDPGRATTELRFVDIRPFSREYEFREGQCNCQGECLTLEKLIAEQRQLLGQTFVANQNERINVQEFGDRQAAQQQELQDKTEAVAAALEQKVGPMPSLTSAVDWMSDAIEDLDAGTLEPAQMAQEKALAKLIAARSNLRKILKQGNSASQQVRQMDKMRRDQVRKPEQKKDQPKDQQQRLAELRKEIEKLAKSQQSFCESAQSCKQSGSLSSSASGESSTEADSENGQKPTPQQLASQQRSDQAKANELAKQLKQASFGDLASRRAEQAADSIKKSAEALADEESVEALDKAIAEAAEAADRLQRLSEHLSQKHHPDFEDKLAAAKRKSERLGDRQQALAEGLGDSKSKADRDGMDASTKEQQDLREQTEELADLVDQLLAESTEQGWDVQEMLSRQTAENSPRHAAEQMSNATSSLQKGQSQSAARSGKSAAGTLQRFAAGLGQVGKAMGPAKLEKLTNAEQKAAALIKELHRASSAAANAMAGAEAKRFADSLQPLATSDPELKKAAEEVGRFATSPRRLVEGLKELDGILQRRIQEAVISGVMQQADGPVPPEYVDLVEEYYRTLSEDLE